jgi:hypothetical protein
MVKLRPASAGVRFDILMRLLSTTTTTTTLCWGFLRSRYDCRLFRTSVAAVTYRRDVNDAVASCVKQLKMYVMLVSSIRHILRLFSHRCLCYL